MDTLPLNRQLGILLDAGERHAAAYGRGAQGRVAAETLRLSLVCAGIDPTLGLPEAERATPFMFLDNHGHRVRVLYARASARVEDNTVRSTLEGAFESFVRVCFAKWGFSLAVPPPAPRSAPAVEQPAPRSVWRPMVIQGGRDG